MKIGLLSDVHGNSAALTAVLAAARSAGVDRLLIAGDLVGYYYDPAGCLALLRDWTTTWVRGNHEDLLDASEQASATAADLRAKYGSGLAVASATLSAEARDEINTWPRVAELHLDGRHIRLCHGAPWGTDEYVYPDAPEATWVRMAEGGADLVVFGHTHYRVDRRVGRTRLVNPGSVGQARDGAGGACWAVYDTSTGECDLRIERYDPAIVARDAQARDPHLLYLADVLYREKARA